LESGEDFGSEELGFGDDVVELVELFGFEYTQKVVFEDGSVGGAEAECLLKGERGLGVVLQFGESIAKVAQQFDVYPFFVAKSYLPA
jgi:hypothetical protein